MNFNISPDRTLLTLTVSDAERAELREVRNLDSDHAMHDFFERMVANSELEWVDPEWTGDLTSAPMIGIFGEDTTKPGGRPNGSWGGKEHYNHVLERWAFMQYQVVSLLRTLLQDGVAVLVGVN